jgi:TatA/E family protein of Tat protein translocase
MLPVRRKVRTGGLRVEIGKSERYNHGGVNMFGSIGMPELVLIFVVALLVFGPKKLPEIGKSIGKGLAEFKRASDDLKKTIEQEIEQGKHEVSSVKEHVASIPATLKSAAPLESYPAPAPALPAEPAAAVASAAPVETPPQPDSRPIEPS